MHHTYVFISWCDPSKLFRQLKQLFFNIGQRYLTMCKTSSAEMMKDGKKQLLRPCNKFDFNGPSRLDC